MAAIGAGARAHSTILGRTALSATTVNETLDLLRTREVVQRLTPYSTKATNKTVLWEVVDPYIRFWLSFVDRRIDLIERGRGALLLERFKRTWPTFRGRAIELLVRESLERLLPDVERFGAARHVGSYWNRTGTVEVDLVGGNETPVAKQIGFVGSIKWRENRAFDPADGLALGASREAVPGATNSTALVGVSAQGFDDDAPLDVRIGPEELVASWAH